ncbi:MAG: hypothetical protein ACK4TA_02035 [Saprospiraceae bacterium]
MQTNYTNDRQNKRSIEGILLALLFIFGMMGFIYAFSNKDKAKTEKVVTVQPAQTNQN